MVGLWQDCMPNGKLYNLYGPTEATIWCTGYCVETTHMKSYNQMLMIGKPFKRVDALILDESGQAIGIGQKGELAISSDQLTAGYLNASEKNESFFFTKGDNRFYKTGDLCFMDEEGDIYYCGRMDHQVKIQGFRIELSELEIVVRDAFQINNVAIAYKNELGVEAIGLFVESAGLDHQLIRTELERKLPYYMIPSVIRNIDQIPVNLSGKTDRVKLEQLLQSTIL